MSSSSSFDEEKDRAKPSSLGIFPSAEPASTPGNQQKEAGGVKEFIDSALNTTTPLRHLASQSSLGSSRSRNSSEVRSTKSRRSKKAFHPLSVTFEEQRHEAPRGFSITKNTKPWDPTLPGVPEGEAGELQSTKDPEAENSSQPAGNQADEDEPVNNYPSSLGLTVLIIGLCLSVFLISLDRTIITTVSRYGLLWEQY